MATIKSPNYNGMDIASATEITRLRFVSRGASGGDHTAAGARAEGVSQQASASGTAERITIAELGKGDVKVECGGTIAVGADVASDASGRAITATGGAVVLGNATEAGVTGRIITIQVG